MTCVSKFLVHVPYTLSSLTKRRNHGKIILTLSLKISDEYFSPPLWNHPLWIDSFALGREKIRSPCQDFDWRRKKCSRISSSSQNGAFRVFFSLQVIDGWSYTTYVRTYDGRFSDLFLLYTDQSRAVNALIVGWWVARIFVPSLHLRLMLLLSPQSPLSFSALVSACVAYSEVRFFVLF